MVAMMDDEIWPSDIIWHRLGSEKNNLLFFGFIFNFLYFNFLDFILMLCKILSSSWLHHGLDVVKLNVLECRRGGTSVSGGTGFNIGITVGRVDSIEKCCSGSISVTIWFRF